MDLSGHLSQTQSPIAQLISLIDQSAAKLVESSASGPQTQPSSSPQLRAPTDFHGLASGVTESETPQAAAASTRADARFNPEPQPTSDSDAAILQLRVSVSSINLGNNRLGPSVAPHIQRMLLLYPNLTSLRLPNCDLMDEGVVALLNAWATGPQVARQLLLVDLSDNQLSVLSLPHLAATLITNAYIVAPRLASISIAGNTLNNEGAFVLAKAITEAVEKGKLEALS